MASKAQIEASNRYNQENTKTVLLRFNVVNDTDIIRHLETKTSKLGYIKELIRADMNK